MSSFRVECACRLRTLDLRTVSRRARPAAKCHSEGCNEPGSCRARNADTSGATNVVAQPRRRPCEGQSHASADESVHEDQCKPYVRMKPRCARLQDFTVRYLAMHRCGIRAVKNASWKTESQRQTREHARKNTCGILVSQQEAWAGALEIALRSQAIVRKLATALCAERSETLAALESVAPEH